LRQQFDLLPPGADFGGYRLVIVLETTRVDDALKAKLQTYLAAGGALIVCGPAAFDVHGEPALPELGIEAHGASPYTHTFLRAVGDIGAGMPEFDTVMYERGFRVTARDGAEVLVQVVEPYFERSYDRFSGHDYTPPDRLSPYAAAVQNGRAITFAVPILEAFGKHASVAYRQILDNCIARLLPDPLIRDGGPAHVEATAVRRGDATIVHLISFLPSRQAEGLDIVTDPFPLVDMPLSVRLDRTPDRVMLQPAGVDLPFTYADGYAQAQITMLNGHAMVVLE
jgi:hypothetical protein